MLRVTLLLAAGAAVCEGWGTPSSGVAARVSSSSRSTVQAGLFGRKAAVDLTTEYDYIIVGGGTAGCVLANRLSAKPDARVLVIEAGKDKSHKEMKVKVPVGLLKILRGELDWNYNTASTDSVAGREVYLCRGKALGGSSCTNVMLYNRGAAGDYDNWAAECGDETWNAANMLPFFKKAEDCHAKTASREYHGKGGPYTTSDVPYQNPMSKAFLKAATEAGEASNPDFNDWSQPQAGFGRFQVSQRKGRRVEAASTYLDPVRSRKNLDIITGALATNIELDGKDVAATGVAYIDSSGEKRIAKLASSGEVLLTLGAIGSPQLLMLSGVGPADHLKQQGVALRADVPGVGSNLQDHPAVLLSYSAEGKASARGVSHSSKLRQGPDTTKISKAALAQWLLLGKGPLSSPGCDHGGFAHSAPANALEGKMPDLQYRFLASKTISPDGMTTISEEYLKSKGHPDGITLQTICARPHTRGQLRLRSSNPADKPVIEKLYLEDPRDVQSLVNGLRKARGLCEQKSLEPFRAYEEFPGVSATSDEQLEDYVRKSVHSANALVGSCKMGKQGDRMAVVDNELRVRGIRGVRVCDASIMPSLPGGQTASSTIAIAEKAAEMLQSRRAEQQAPAAAMATA